MGSARHKLASNGRSKNLRKLRNGVYTPRQFILDHWENWRWANHIWDITHLFFALTTKGVGIDIMIVIFDSSVDAPVRTGSTFTMDYI